MKLSRVSIIFKIKYELMHVHPEISCAYITEIERRLMPIEEMLESGRTPPKEIKESIKRIEEWRNEQLQLRFRDELQIGCDFYQLRRIIRGARSRIPFAWSKFIKKFFGFTRAQVNYYINLYIIFEDNRILSNKTLLELYEKHKICKNAEEESTFCYQQSHGIKRKLLQPEENGILTFGEE